MTVTIPDVMRHVRNHFPSAGFHEKWQLRAGLLTPETFLPGEWIAITSQDAPQGVYQLDENGTLPGLADHAWEGNILLLEPPESFLRLCREIASWAQAHPDPAVTSERFGDYSRASSGESWTKVFAPQLAAFTHMYQEVNF